MYLFYTSADMFGGPTCSLYHNSLSYSLTICSLACGYITTEDWQIARLTFRPKPEQTDYMAAKSFWSISLTSFLLKGLEELVEKCTIGITNICLSSWKISRKCLLPVSWQNRKIAKCEQYAFGTFFILNKPLIKVLEPLLTEIINWNFY